MKIVKAIILIVMVSISMTTCQESQKQNVTIDTENQTLKTIFNRKSVREYSNKEISNDNISKLLKAGMAAPSSRDRRPWHFIVISDKNLLQTLGEQLKTAASLKNANKAILVCGDVDVSDNCWFLDCAAATQNILIAAESLGIGAVWTAVYPYEDRAAILDGVFQLPENIKAFAILPMGYPAGENAPKDKFDETRIHYHQW